MVPGNGLENFKRKLESDQQDKKRPELDPYQNAMAAVKALRTAMGANVEAIMDPNRQIEDQGYRNNPDIQKEEEIRRVQDSFTRESIIIISQVTQNFEAQIATEMSASLRDPEKDITNPQEYTTKRREELKNEEIESSSYKELKKQLLEKFIENSSSLGEQTRKTCEVGIENSGKLIEDLLKEETGTLRDLELLTKKLTFFLEKDGPNWGISLARMCDINQKKENLEKVSTPRAECFKENIKIGSAVVDNFVEQGRKVESFEEMIELTETVLNKTLAKDLSTLNHSKRVSEKFEKLLNGLKDNPEIENMMAEFGKEFGNFLGGTTITDVLKSIVSLHDIGKSGIPVSTLQARRLSNPDFNLVKTHTTNAKIAIPLIFEKIRNTKFADKFLEISETVALLHHIINGYPVADIEKKKKRYPFVETLIQLVSLCDIADAAMADFSRKYSNVDIEKNIKILIAEAGSKIKPEFVAAYIKIMREEAEKTEKTKLQDAPQNTGIVEKYENIDSTSNDMYGAIKFDDIYNFIKENTSDFTRTTGAHTDIVYQVVSFICRSSTRTQDNAKLEEERNRLGTRPSFMENVKKNVIPQHKVVFKQISEILEDCKKRLDTETDDQTKENIKKMGWIALVDIAGRVVPNNFETMRRNEIVMNELLKAKITVDNQIVSGQIGIFDIAEKIKENEPLAVIVKKDGTKVANIDRNGNIFTLNQETKQFDQPAGKLTREDEIIILKKDGEINIAVSGERPKEYEEYSKTDLLVHENKFITVQVKAQDGKEDEFASTFGVEQEEILEKIDGYPTKLKNLMLFQELLSRETEDELTFVMRSNRIDGTASEKYNTLEEIIQNQPLNFEYILKQTLEKTINSIIDFGKNYGRTHTIEKQIDELLEWLPRKLDGKSTEDIKAKKLADIAISPEPSQ